MKVTEIKTGRVLDVNSSYGARLIEQGKAVPAASQTIKKSVKKAGS